jgi:hypothetical protein
MQKPLPGKSPLGVHLPNYPKIPDSCVFIWFLLFARVGDKVLFPTQNFTAVSASAQQGRSGKAGQIGLVCPLLTWCRICRHIRVC